MIEVPTVADVVKDRARLTGLSFEVLWALLLDVGQLEREITVAMGRAIAQTAQTPAEPEDRLLTTEEAAARFRVTTFTMLRYARRKPYDAAVVTLSGATIRWSAQRLDNILLGRGAGTRRKAATL